MKFHFNWKTFIYYTWCLMIVVQSAFVAGYYFIDIPAEIVLLPFTVVFVGLAVAGLTYILHSLLFEVL